jgi:Uma2 family endonuclease
MMAEPLPIPPGKLTREEYRRWAEAQPRGRYELVAGEVFAMAPERFGHAQIKAAAWLALRQAIKAAGVGCQALPDGITVEVDESTDFEPDALVNCGERPDPDAVAAPNPVVVVEVTSRSTQSVDTGYKLTGYFRVPSIRHYLVVLTERRMLIHHNRRDDGGIETRMVVSGRVEMDPPGIAITVEELFEE